MKLKVPKFTASSLFAISLFLSGAAVSAPPELDDDAGDQGRRGGAHRHHEGRHDRLLDQLGLTADQRAAIKAHRDQKQKQVAPLREAMKERRRELDALWRQDRPDRAAILQKSREVDALRDQLREHKIDGRLHLATILTAEQRVKMQELKKSHRGKGQKRGGRGGERTLPPV
jgi:Spy/CpxP family protein refolding chaperone